MVHDVFISYSSKDKTIADGAVANLEANNIRCWIAPRDIKAGDSWSEAIIDAINESRVLVLVFSSDSNQSNQVVRELDRAVSNGIPIVPFKIENIMPSKSVEYFTSTSHWLDAIEPPLDNHFKKLIKTVNSITGTLNTLEVEDIKTVPYKVEVKKYNKIVRIFGFILGLLGVFSSINFFMNYKEASAFIVIAYGLQLLFGLFLIVLGAVPTKANQIFLKSIENFSDSLKIKLNKWFNINKKYNIIVVVSILVVLFSYGATFDIDPYSPSYYMGDKADDVSFMYPSHWMALTFSQDIDDSLFLYEIAGYYDLPNNEIENETFFVIEKVPSSDPNNSIKEDYEKYIKNLTFYKDKALISETDKTVNGVPGYEEIVKLGNGNYVSTLVLRKNNIMYILSFVTNKKFEQYQGIYNMIANSIIID